MGNYFELEGSNENKTSKVSFTCAIDLLLNPYSWPYLILVRFLFLKKKFLEYLLTHYMETKSEKWLEHDYLFSATIFIYFKFLNSTNFKMCCFEYSVYSICIHRFQTKSCMQNTILYKTSLLKTILVLPVIL